MFCPCPVRHFWSPSSFLFLPPLDCARRKAHSSTPTTATPNTTCRVSIVAAERYALAQSTRAHTTVSCAAERQAKQQPTGCRKGTAAVLAAGWGAFVAGRRRGKRGEDAGGSWECDLLVSARCGLCGVCGLLCLSPPSSREGSQSRWPVSTRSLWD